MSLSVQDLWVAYDGVDTLNGVSFELPAGESLAVCGPNGAGKSTLLRAIMAMIRERRGTVRLFGEDISRLPTHRIILKGVTLIPEGRQVFARLTVRENLEIGGYILASQKERRERLEQVVERFPILKDRLKQLAGFLSGGEQQLLAFARGLMSGAKYLLIDEPFLGLSPANIEVVSMALEDIKKDGVAILVADEDSRNVLRIVSHVLWLDNGIMRSSN